MLEEVISTGSQGVLLNVHVRPGARRVGIVGIHGDSLRVAVAARPRDGEANREVVAMLADLIGIPHRDVAITSGPKSRRKRVLIRGVTESRVRERVADAL